MPGLVEDADPGEVMPPDPPMPDGPIPEEPMPVAALGLLALGERGIDGKFCKPAPLLVPSAEPLPLVVDCVGLAIWAAAPEEPVAGDGGALLAAPAPMVWAEAAAGTASRTPAISRAFMVSSPWTCAVPTRSVNELFRSGTAA